MAKILLLQSRQNHELIRIEPPVHTFCRNRKELADFSRGNSSFQTSGEGNSFQQALATPFISARHILSGLTAIYIRSYGSTTLGATLSDEAKG